MISILILTKNEERDLPGCLASVAWSDDVHVFDSLSTDATAEIAKAAYRGQAPYILRVAGTDLANIRSGTIKEAIEAGDKIVEEIIRDGARQLGIVLAGTVNLLAPDVIVLGGGLVEALPRLFLEEVGKAVADRVMPSYLKTYELKVAKLGDDAGAMGAAAWAKHRIDD